MNDTTSLLTNVLHMWMVPDQATRRSIIEQSFRENVEIHDHNGQFSGYEGVEMLSTYLRDHFAGAVFELTAPVDQLDNAVRAFWRFGPSDNPEAVTGMDFAIIEDGKISKFYAFVSVKE